MPELTPEQKKQAAADKKAADAKIKADKKAADAKAKADKKDLAKEVLNPTQLRQLEAKKLRAANKKKAEAAAKKAEAKKEDDAATATKAATNPKKDNRKLFKDDRGQQFRFKKSAPKALNIDGVSTSIDDIIEDEEIMLELVNGNSNYLEQIY